LNLHAAPSVVLRVTPSAVTSCGNPGLSSPLTPQLPTLFPGATVIDSPERGTAAQIERNRPYWIVIWGCYTRMYWAFPRFPAPKGTIVSAPDPDRLLAGLDCIEDEARKKPAKQGWPNQLLRRRSARSGEPGWEIHRQAYAMASPRFSPAVGSLVAALPGKGASSATLAASEPSLLAAPVTTAETASGSARTVQDPHESSSDSRRHQLRIWRTRRQPLASIHRRS
jgi:hypothetical protein